MRIRKLYAVGLAALLGLVVFKFRHRPFSWWLSAPEMTANWARHFGRLIYQWTGLDDKGLNAWSKSQYGEDVALLPLLLESKGYAVEVGANNGVANSNTFLYERLGWTGLLIEPDPEMAADCKENRPAFKTVQAACVAPDGPDTVTFRIVKERQLSFACADPAYLAESEARFGRKNIKSFVVPAKTLD